MEYVRRRTWLILLMVGLPAMARGAQLPPAQDPLASFSGPVREIDGKSLTMLDGDGDDANRLRFVLTHKTHFYKGDTKIKASAIKPGDRVLVETKRFPDGELEAVNVRLQPQKPDQK